MDQEALCEDIKLPVDKVKIDGVFIRGLEADGPNYAIVKAVVSIARAFGLETVAEFTDNRRTIDLLAALGVDFAQGHGISEAMPIEVFFGLSAPDVETAAAALP
ncbi:MAG: EAL domain-containing protein [Desulfuromonadales bacterium]